MHYKFDVMIPQNRVGHHVLWIAWQRDDPVGEVFFSTSDLMIATAARACRATTTTIIAWTPPTTRCGEIMWGRQRRACPTTSMAA